MAADAISNGRRARSTDLDGFNTWHRLQTDGGCSAGGRNELQQPQKKESKILRSDEFSVFLKTAVVVSVLFHSPKTCVVLDVRRLCAVQEHHGNIKAVVSNTRRLCGKGLAPMVEGNIENSVTSVKSTGCESFEHDMDVLCAGIQSHRCGVWVIIAGNCGTDASNGKVKNGKGSCKGVARELQGRWERWKE